MNLQVKIFENELWYGGSVADAMQMPIDISSKYFLDMECGLNQTMPLYVSTRGRYIWCEEPMVVTVENGVFNINAPTEIILWDEGETLKDAYLDASSKYFKFSGKVPPIKFFETAQYNTIRPRYS